MNYEFTALTDSVSLMELYEIYRHCMYMPTKEKFIKQYKSWCANKNIKIYMAVYQGKLVGVIVILLEENRSAEIIGISVAEDFRNRGVGSYMIKKIREKHSIERMYAETDNDAVGFYRRTDFEVVEKIKTVPNTYRYLFTLVL